jgi:outer membrane protein assembly factor BamB
MKSDTASPLVKPQNARLLYLAAWSMSLVAVLFCLVLGALMTANYIQVKRTDPLNNALLVKLRAQAVADPANTAIKDEVRSLDLLARKVYFAGQTQLRNGTILLICGVVIAVALLNLAGVLRQQIPDPEQFPLLESLWTELWHRRIAISVTGSILLAGAITASFLASTELNRETIQQALTPKVVPTEIPPTPNAPPSPQIVPPSTKPITVTPPTPAISRETWLKQWPNFRGPDGIGIAHVDKAPTTWDGKAGTNIKWKTQIPLEGFSSPIVWDKRVFVTGGTSEKRALYCLNADTGAIEWTATDADVPGSPTEPPAVNDNTGWAASSPATDGTHVFAIFANGNLIACDMTGKIAWSRNVGPIVNHYAHSSSLIVWNNILVVQLDSDQNPRLLGLDTRTGKDAWKVERSTISWASPVCVNTGKRWELIAIDSGTVAGFDPASGKQLWSHKGLTGEVAPSPGYANGLVLAASDSGMMAIKIGENKLEHAWVFDEEISDTSSPLATDQIAFLATSGSVVACIDMKTGKSVWVHQFDAAFTSSPVSANGMVYATDSAGTTHVFQVAKEFKLVASNKLGEKVMATPAIVEGRIFLRGNQHVYCIEQPQQVARD